MKKPAFPTENDLITGWLDLNSAEDGSPEYEESFWSFMMFDDLVDEFPDDALRVICKILAVNDSFEVKGTLSAGAMEDLLVRHGADVIHDVERIARETSSFASMLGGVWQRDMDKDIWDRLNAVWDRRGWDGN